MPKRPQLEQPAKNRRRLGGGLAQNVGGIPWPFMQWGARQRYHVENFRAALDEPGEWFLDRDGTLLYKPLPGEDPAKAEVIAPRVESFVQIAGDPAGGKLVEHVTLRGLAFRHSAYVLPPQGHGDSQAAVSVPAAVTIDGARNVTIEDCEVGHVGGTGVWFRRGCRECRIARSYVHDLGACGVRIGQGWENPHPKPEDQTAGVTVDNNIILYWKEGGGPVTFEGMTLDKWQASGKDAGSLVADPRFIDPAKGDFRLGPDSPAAKVGFVPFDYSKAGVYGDPEWVGQAGAVEYPAVEFAPDPPPLPPLAVDDSFETPRTVVLPDARVSVEGRGDALAVTEETAASGKRSLKAVDAPGLQHGFNPHFFYVPRHREGVTRCAFDLRLEPGAVVFHEWRDDAHPQ